MLHPPRSVLIGKHGMQLVAQIEGLNTEISKQRYRVDSHILPYIEKLREENEKLKATLREHHNSAGVMNVSSGVSNLKLSPA